MKNRVITISREFGSGGRTIGKRVAEKLGIPCYDAEIIEKMAKETGFAPDYVKEAGEYAPGSFLSSAFSNRMLGPTNEDILWEHQYKVITDLAAKGPCIIVGRCADLVLTGQNVDCLSLFICAPFEWRVHHRMELENLDEKAARALVEKTDAQREKYYTHYTGRPWGLPENYDICINSARLGIDRTAALLAEHCRELFSNPC